MYGFSLKSLFVSVIVAVFIPIDVGLNRTVKVLFVPALIVVPVGFAVMLKSLGFAPEIVGLAMVSDVVPRLSIVNTLLMVPLPKFIEPKSVGCEWSCDIKFLYFGKVNLISSYDY